MRSWLRSWIDGRKVLIAGFGREGHSSFRILSEILDAGQIAIADRNESALDMPGAQGFRCHSGAHEQWPLHEYDIIIKSPGLPQEMFDNYGGLLTTQVDLFFMHYGSQSIGVTGTKGKSTTSSLLFHILKRSGRHVLLAGNIGVPIFDILDDIAPETIIVCELSAHQLENTWHVPNVSILLNFFPEHLDHFKSYEHYKRMKAHIATRQYEDGIIVIPAGQPELEDELLGICSSILRIDPGGAESSSMRLEGGRYLLEIEGLRLDLLPQAFECQLPGDHNRLNALCAAAAALLCGADGNAITAAVADFNPLPHRIEPLGVFNGVSYYNDSIATVPQASIAALNALGFVDTLILGGFDRGLDYSPLYRELRSGRVATVLFIGKAGRRMWEESREVLLGFVHAECHEYLKDAVARARVLTPAGGKCLLSPAAASYDQYSGFEERGDDFRKLVGGNSV